MTRVLLLGVTGMLGGMVADVLATEPDLELVGTSRGAETPEKPFAVHRFDAREDDPSALLDATRPDWVVNAVGVTKPHIDAESAADVAAALDVNARFPYALAQAAESHGARVIQIATDGVFSGLSGSYREDAPHDAIDVYGKTKSLGEVPGATVVHPRCSIIGPEDRDGSSLVAWLLAQPEGRQVTGYVDHRWNGVTTWHFARICAGIIRERLELPSPLHVVPANVVTKAELLEAIAHAFGRRDLTVEAGNAPVPNDRYLATNHPDANERLWHAAGYGAAPSVQEMVEELGRHGRG